MNVADKVTVPPKPEGTKPEGGAKPRGRPRTKPKPRLREKRVLGQSSGSKSKSPGSPAPKRPSSSSGVVQKSAAKLPGNEAKASGAPSKLPSEPTSKPSAKPSGTTSKPSGAPSKPSGTPSKPSGGQQPRASRETRGSIGSTSDEQRKSTSKAEPDNSEGRINVNWINKVEDESAPKLFNLEGCALLSGC